VHCLKLAGSASNSSWVLTSMIFKSSPPFFYFRVCSHFRQRIMSFPP
jgi:hypothetical protein